MLKWTGDPQLLRRTEVYQAATIAGATNARCISFSRVGNQEQSQYELPGIATATEWSCYREKKCNLMELVQREEMQLNGACAERKKCI